MSSHDRTDATPALPAMGPDLYRANPNRRAGVAAGPGGGRRRYAPMPVPAVLGSAARADTAGDPADANARVAAELFWFWPASGGHDPALAALEGGDIERALSSWTDRMPDGIAAHNLAVLHHALALDWEIIAARDGAAPDAIRDLEAVWCAALRHWADAIESAEFWGELRRRVRRLDEPRIRSSVTRRIREVLARELLGINLRIGLEAARAGRADVLARHLSLVGEAPFAKSVLRNALDENAGGIARGIAGVISDKLAEIDMARADAPAKLQALRTELEPELALLSGLFPRQDADPFGVRQTVISGIGQLAVAYARRHGDWTATARMLRDWMPLAEGAANAETFRALTDAVGSGAEGAT